MIYFSIIIFLFVLITITAKYKSRKTFLIFKPATTILIILLAILNYSGNNYFLFLVSGLIFSLLGDIFLMFEQKYFVHGLIAFLITHIFYSIAFYPQANLNLYVLPVIIGFSLMIYFLIYKNLNRYKLPVIIYMLFASVMVWMAVNNFLTFQTERSVFIVCGAILFILSDSVLALNKFGREVRFGEIFILGSYYAAQYFIALSISF